MQIAAGHQYEYGAWSMGNHLANLFTKRDSYQPNPFTASVGYGKQVWMSEWSTAAFSSTSEMNQALVVARAIHQDFTRSHLNAFVFWWSNCFLGYAGPGKGLPTKNLWAVAQYSRFARPGWRVLSATPTPASGVYLTAFANPSTNALSIVAVNTSTSPRTITLALSGGSRLGTLNLYRTSASEEMAAVGSVIVNGTSQAVTLAPSSVSTYYGNAVP